MYTLYLTSYLQRAILCALCYVSIINKTAFLISVGLYMIGISKTTSRGTTCENIMTIVKHSEDIIISDVHNEVGNRCYSSLQNLPENLFIFKFSSVIK